MKRFLFGMIAVVLGALACRQGQPPNDPKQAPNDPLPKIERPTDDNKPSSPPSPLTKDAG